MKETGGNQYKPAHNNSINRKKETGSPSHATVDLRVNLEDSRTMIYDNNNNDRCVAHLNAWIYDRLYS